MNVEFTLNGEKTQVDVEEDTPLLWILRDTLGLTGTKFGCGRALCGACTVHVDGRTARSCAYPARFLAGKSVRTIEAIEDDPVGREVVKTWIEMDVVQCGWCQPGQCMSATALISELGEVDDAAIDAGMSGNLCRCGTYPRIREAVRAASKNVSGRGEGR